MRYAIICQDICPDGFRQKSERIQDRTFFLNLMSGTLLILTIMIFSIVNEKFPLTANRRYQLIKIVSLLSLANFIGSCSKIKSTEKNRLIFSQI